MALVVLGGPNIPAGESLSEGLDCTGGSIVRITMPAQWTPANLTFAISSDGTFYNDLVDRKGEEIAITVVPGTAFVVGQYGDFLKAIAFLKVRSGSREFPVVQETLRQFAVAIEPSA
jgi:hypothetical protein